MKTRTLAIVLGLVIVVAAVGAFFLVPRAPAEPIKIGIITPLSPPGDPGAGQRIVRGIEIAVSLLNEKGGVAGRKVEVIIEDDSGTPEKGVAAARKLVTSDKVSIITGQYHSSVALQVQDVVEQFGLPIIMPHPSAVKVTEKGLKWTFRVHVTDIDRTDALARWAKEKGFKRVAVLAENTDFGIAYVDNTKANFKKYGVGAEIFDIIFDRRSTDLTPELLKVKAWGPDLVVNVGVGAPTFLLVNQASDVGILPKVPMVAGFDWPSRPEFWDNVKERGTGLIFITTFHPKMKLTTIGDQFRQAYMKKHGEDPIYPDFQGFSSIMLIAQAIEKAGSTDPEKVRQALLNNEFEWWNKKFRFTQEPGYKWQHVSVPILLLQYTAFKQPLVDTPIIFTG